jgi:hypothetical protein
MVYDKVYMVIFFIIETARWNLFITRMVDDPNDTFPANPAVFPA